LKVLTDREVSPQLGLLKSTLLQLDSTFSERDYGAGTFRDFIEKMATAGYVTLKQVDRSLLVESTDVEAAAAAPAAASTTATVVEEPERETAAVAATTDGTARESLPAPTAAEPAAPRHQGHHGSSSGPTPEQVDEAVRNLTDIFKQATVAPHWPMYLRNVKQYIKNAGPTFDERKFGFTNFLETVRACQRAGLFRLERNRQGILRVFPGPQFPSQLSSSPMSASERERAVEAAYIAAAEAAIMAASQHQPQSSLPSEPVLEDTPVEVSAETEPVEEEMAEKDEKAEKPVRRRPRSVAEGAKRKPAARRASAARRPPRKKSETETAE
jgi:hypothetical protein